MINWFKKGVNSSIVLWVFLTIIIVISNSFFKINDYVSVPQHGYFDDFDFISEYIKENNKVFLYRLFFVLDFFWAFFLLSIIGHKTKEMDKKYFYFPGGRKISQFQIFAVLAVFAFLFDVAEGICYVFYFSKHLATITSIKVILYILCFAFFLYWLLRKYVVSDFKSIFRFLQSSILSLVFILLIYMLLTAMPQGGTLIVYLFYSPLNIIFFFFLLTFLAIMISHFPVYVDIWLYGDNDSVELKMSDRGLRLFGFGIIYFNTLKSSVAKAHDYNNKRVSALRRSLGVFLYVAVFNIFLGVASQFFEYDFSANGVTVVILILTLLIYHNRGEIYLQWRKDLESDTNDAEKKKAVILKIIKYVSWFPFYFVICTAMVLITAAVAYNTEWSRISLVLLLVTLTLQLFLYTYFKICRSYFKYVFTSDKLKAFNPDMYDSTLEGLFKEHDPNPKRGDSWYYRQYGKLSDNVQYLKLMQLSGYISLGVLILANFIFDFASALNPLNIILLYIIIIYSVLIITFKHVLYYHRSDEGSMKYRDFFRYGIPVFTILALVWFSYNASLENDLHQLQLVDREVAPIEASEFFESMTNGQSTGQSDNYFFVGSYGGGLKANLWNLLIFNELEKRTDNDFLKRTIAMSGVSGGAVGIGNFAALKYEIQDQATIDSRIFEIGKSNVLSNELVYLLGKDLVREYLPYFDYQGQDRSYKSMKNHAKLTGMGDGYNTMSYSDYWRKMYKKQNGKFPALIMNTTSTSGKQGVASSVKFPESTFSAADDILTFNDKIDSSLTYFGAVSTTNRFPLFSPTAGIPSKGSYLDGGYFENSGMLSLLEITDYLRLKSDYKEINPVFINIINSEAYYITQKVLKDWEFKKVGGKSSGELSSIVATVVSIDKLPRYVFDKIQNLGYIIEPIMMPHKISYTKVKSLLGGDVDDPIRLINEIEKHNAQIDSALIRYEPYKHNKWGVVQPPLARVLSEPAVLYQEAMVNSHPDVLDTFDRIQAYIASDTKLNIEFQQNLKGMGNLDKEVRVSSTEMLIKEEANNPIFIREVLSSLKQPKSENGLWNNIVFLNATKKEAYDAELINFALTEIEAFENGVKNKKLGLGPRTKKSLENYKNYLLGIKKQL